MARMIQFDKQHPFLMVRDETLKKFTPHVVREVSIAKKLSEIFYALVSSSTRYIPDPIPRVMIYK